MIEDITAQTTKEILVEGKRPDFLGWARPPKYKGYIFSENNSSLAGPISQHNLTTITSDQKAGNMYGVNESNELLESNIKEINDQVFSKAPDDLWWDIEYPLGIDEHGIVGSETDGAFAYRGKALQAPFHEPMTGEAYITDPLYFRNSYLSIIETNWVHLGDEHNEKQLHRIDLSFHKNSTGHLWGYGKSDDGLVKGQYKGLIQEHMKVFMNLRGRRFKFKLFVATHNNYPWALREMSIGHLFGKSF
jgi:hypothetical protein